MFILILLNVQTKHCVHFNIILSKIWVNMRKKQIVNAKPKNEHTILNNFFRPLHIFPMLLGHQETLPKHSHHSSSQSMQFPENRHICLKTGQVISKIIPPSMKSLTLFKTNDYNYLNIV